MLSATFAAVGLFAAFMLYRELKLYLRRCKIIHNEGCMAPPRLPQFERVLGLDALQDALKNTREKRYLDMLNGRHERLGNTYSFTLAGSHWIMTTEPENIKAINTSQFRQFDVGPIRHRAFSPIIGEGMIVLDNAPWERSRAMVRPSFLRSQVTNVKIFETHTNHLIDAIPRDGSTVDLRDYFFRLTMDTTTEYLFGESLRLLQSELNPESERFFEAYAYTQRAAIKRFRLGILLRFTRDRKFNQSCEIIHDYTDKFVQKALDYRSQFIAKGNPNDDESLHGEYVFLNEIAKQTDDREELRAQLLSLLLAGSDTTSSLLTTTLFVLATRPDIWQKLRAEVTLLGAAKPTSETLKDIKYVRYVLNEVLRLYPVIPGSARIANHDTTLPVGGGPDAKSKVFIKKNQIVTHSLYIMHRRKDLFGEDAELFRPERWETLSPGWSYQPFSSGPRICIGQTFALTEASYVLARLVQEFKDIESRDPVWEEDLGIVLTNARGAKVSLTPA